MIINISPTVRIETGPRRVTAVATRELLDDKATARHYKEGSLDAKGRTIRLGQEMEYIDWRGRKKSDGVVWNLYQLQNVAEGSNPPDGGPEGVERYVRIGVYETLPEAETAAHAL